MWVRPQLWPAHDSTGCSVGKRSKTWGRAYNYVPPSCPVAWGDRGGIGPPMFLPQKIQMNRSLAITFCCCRHIPFPPLWGCRNAPGFDMYSTCYVFSSPFEFEMSFFPVALPCFAPLKVQPPRRLTPYRTPLLVAFAVFCSDPYTGSSSSIPSPPYSFVAFLLQDHLTPS